MPPKKKTPASKASNKKTSTPLASSLTKVTPSGAQKRTADTDTSSVANASKKAKVGVSGTAATEGKTSDAANNLERAASEDDDNPWALLSDEDFHKASIYNLKEKFNGHVPQTMGFMLKAIQYDKALPDGASVVDLGDLLREELRERIIAGRDIAEELEEINKIDEKWWEGEYDDEIDDDGDGLDKGVQKRLDSAESMLQFMAGGALKSIMRQLNPYAHGGTNRHMADTILSILERLAQDGKDIKREYMIVKSFGIGCCGHDSDPDLNFDLDDDDDY